MAEKTITRPVWTYKRSRHCATLAGPEYYSVMPTHGAKLFGLRLHLTTTLAQIVDQWLLVPAASRDSKMADLYQCVVHGLPCTAIGRAFYVGLSRPGGFAHFGLYLIVCRSIHVAADLQLALTVT